MRQPRNHQIGAKLFHFDACRTALLHITQRCFVGQQVGITIGEGQRNISVALHRRVSCGPTQRNCTSREKKPLSHRLIAAGAIRAVKWFPHTSVGASSGGEVCESHERAAAVWSREMKSIVERGRGKADHLRELSGGNERPVGFGNHKYTIGARPLTSARACVSQFHALI